MPEPKTIAFVRHHTTALAFFSISVGLALVIGLVPQFRSLISSVDRLGYPGVLIGGALYSFALTSGTAVLIFTNLDPQYHPLVAGLIGGLGAAIYDTVILLFSRQQSERGWLAVAVERLRLRRPFPSWASLAIASLILASPLPDEFAAGLLGVIHSRPRQFFFLSWVANGLGIAALCWL